MRTTRPARHDSTLVLSRALRVLTLAALVMAFGCGSDPAPAEPMGPQGCPTGSVPWTDGSCMPVGIQGCADIFIEEDGLCHPRMAKCPAGTIPKFDEGCVPVGIQGCAEMFMEEDGLCHPSITKCPAGTIPKFDEGCVPVGIQGCAEVFMEDDGLCHPTMEKCPAGTFAVPQEGCVPIDGPEGCGTGTWGNIQDEPGMPTIWVDPSVATSGNGTKVSPVKTIAEAMPLVPLWGRIALGAGIYDESIHITKPLTVEGRCPSMVRVQGTGSLDPYLYVVRVGAYQVTLRGLEIGGAGVGIIATDSTELQIDRVHVREATLAGLVLQGAVTVASITRSWISGTLAASDGSGGRGIEMSYGARATLDESAIVANRDRGVSAIDPGSELTLTDSLVEGTLPRESDGQHGRGASAEGGATLTLTDCAIVKNHEQGVIAYQNDTELTVDHSLVEGTLPSGPIADFGEGIVAADGAGLTLLGSAILSNHDAGVFLQATGAEVSVTGSLVQGTLPQQSDGTNGAGIYIEGGADLALRESELFANYNCGLKVRGAGTTVTASSIVIESNESSGIDIRSGAALTLDGSAVVENRVVGIAAVEAQTATSGSLIARTRPGARQTEAGGMGVIIDMDAHATLAASALVLNRDAGLFVRGAELTATGNLIARTLPHEGDNDFGRGVDALDGATLVLNDNAIVENHDIGVSAGDDGTTLAATGNIIEGTLSDASSKEYGRGVDISYGAQATLEANAVVGNHDVGLFLLDGSSVLATSGIIEGTLPRESDGQFGEGVVSSNGATLRLESSIVRDNRVSALQVAGATAAVSRTLVDVVPAGAFTLNSVGTFDNVGDGLLATLGSTLDITDTRIQGCVRAGVLFDDSSGTLSGVVSTGNEFGLVLQGERRPSYEDGGNQLTGNAGQDIVLGGDLPIPDAPSPVPPAPAPSP